MPRKVSRAAERQRLAERAAQVKLPQVCDVTVIGGGASGLAAAITAAEAGASVAVLERDLECGRPILATGNGRCNFSNVHLDPARFNDPDFVGAVCGQRWLDDVLDFFRSCGLRWCLEDERLYPQSRVAASVRSVLLARAERAGVILAPARAVHALRPVAEPSSSGIELAHTLPLANSDALGRLRTKAVVIASGGGTAALVTDLDLRTSPERPVLCPLACQESPLARLDGRRAHVQAFLTKQGQLFPSWHERGEVLFRSYGLSGIVTFDLSRRAEPGDLVELDLAPDLRRGELQQLVDPFGSGSFETGCLDGVLDPTIAALLESLARRRWRIEWPEREEPATEAQALLSLVKALPFLVEGPADVDHAQVTRGGLRNDQFDPETLSCHGRPWLFACGEALDVDGDCGGFNLSWAWKSGMVAGAAAARWAQA